MTGFASSQPVWARTLMGHAPDSWAAAVTGALIRESIGVLEDYHSDLYRDGEFIRRHCDQLLARAVETRKAVDVRLRWVLARTHTHIDDGATLPPSVLNDAVRVYGLAMQFRPGATTDENAPITNGTFRFGLAVNPPRRPRPGEHIYVRFEDPATGSVSGDFGPFESVQFTHGELRFGPDGEY